MMIHDITKQAGADKKRKRIGRGIGSGHGKTCGRGTKGAGARSGWSGSIRASREGGQLPWFRRLPKRGFSNANFRVEYYVVNVGDLEAMFEAGATVDAEALINKGMIPNTKQPLKILGDGEITKKLTVLAAFFTKSAEEKLTKAGCTVTWTQPKPAPKPPKQDPAAVFAAKQAAEGKGKKAEGGEKAEKPEKAEKAEKAPKGEKKEKGGEGKAPKAKPEGGKKPKAEPKGE